MSLQWTKIEATSGDNVIVTGSDFPNQRIRVLAYTVLSDADVTIQWKSDSADISGPMPIAERGGVTCTSNFLAPGGPMALMTTLNVGEDLVLNLGSAATVGGHITYYAING